MPQIVTAIEIDAPPEKVWEVLVDTDRYEEWNPLITHLEGSLREGEKVKGKLEIEGRSLPFDAELVKCEPGVALAWKGPWLKPLQFFVSGEHFFEIKDIGEGRSRFLHGEKLRGLLFDMESVWAKTEPKIEPVYARFNEALKARVESPASA